MFEEYDRKIPDYYPTMYMDGYTPDQILHAVRRGMIQRHRESKMEQQIKVLMEAALREMFKDFK